MKILIIDGQGGGIGKQLITAIKESSKDYSITAVGTNSVATGAMLKAGADSGATGENAVVVGCQNADVIIGAIGIAIANSLLGEITATMAMSVGQSNAKKLLIPMNNNRETIVGVPETPMKKVVQNVVEILEELG